MVEGPGPFYGPGPDNVGMACFIHWFLQGKRSQASKSDSCIRFHFTAKLRAYPVRPVLPYRASNIPVCVFFRTLSQSKYWPFIATYTPGSSVCANARALPRLNSPSELPNL